MSRPKVTKIQVWVDGKGPKEIDPDNIDALFLNDRAVKDILVPYYDTTSGASMTGTEAENKWDNPGPDGDLPAYLLKMPNCTLEYP